MEVLFDRIRQENGIIYRLTKVRSPTTTDKIERLHQTLQDELLDVHGPFESIQALQAALNAWREEFNTAGPHQSLGMALPASRFKPRELAAGTARPRPARGPHRTARAAAACPGPAACPGSGAGGSAGAGHRRAHDGHPALEVDGWCPVCWLQLFIAGSNGA